MSTNLKKAMAKTTILVQRDSDGDGIGQDRIWRTITHEVTRARVMQIGKFKRKIKIYEKKNVQLSTENNTTVKPRYNAVSGRHLLRPPYKRDTL